MNTVINKMNSHSKIYKWLIFVLIFVYSAAFAFKLRVDWYVYDSQWYYTKADPVFDYGFDILRFPETFRGYLFPVLIGIFKRLFDGNEGWWVLSSLSVALCFSFILPYLFYGRHIISALEAIRSLLAFFVFMWIWKMFMQYPLSDFPAAILFISGAALLKALDIEKPLLYSCLIGGLSGAFLYAAYNTRIIYLYGCCIVIITFAISNFVRWKKTVVIMASILIGVVIVAIPQCMINNQYLGVYSPKVYSEQIYGYSHNLQSQQLFWGLEWVRFEGYIGDHELYPSDGVIFEDPVGIEILEREEIAEGLFGIKELFKLFLKYPMDIMGIYVRHFISMMTPAYKKIYIENLFFNKWKIVLASVFIWIVAFLGLFESKRRCKIKISDISYFFAVCLPGILQVAGAVEIRFFISVYILVYYYVFAIIDYKDLLLELKDRKGTVIVVIGIVVLMWISIFGDILSNNKETVFLINDFLIE